MNIFTRRTKLALLLTGLSLFLFLTPLSGFAQTPSAGMQFELPPTGLSKGVNLGNTLEAPFEGAWGLVIQEFYFDRIVEAGFDHVRLPISWTHHASNNPPYTIDEVFFERVDELVEQCTSRGLQLIINDHHHEEIDANPLGELPRARAIWQQVAARYQKQPQSVLFEVLNEPHGEFNDDPTLWDFVLAELLDVIRQTNPTRKILVGGVRWNSVGALLDFEMPNDPNLIATFHYYDPFEFTHQGASWVDPIPPTGVEWTGEKRRLADNWQNWSWGTTIEGTNSALEVTYNEGWAGLALFYAANPIENAEGVRITTDAGMLMRVRVTDSNGVVDGIDFQPDGIMKSYFFDLDDFEGVANVKRIDFQNFTSNPQSTFTVRGVAVEGQNRRRKSIHSFGYPIVSTRTVQAIVSEKAAIFETMKQVAEWGRANNTPVYMGEFGAYDQAGMASRVRWTETVRQASETWGLGWGYWEFGAGFGIYDPANDEFRVDLLRSLLPNF